MPKLLVICGPTGSGKTDFAHEIALKNNGEIVNCDSIQIYTEIPILTASPQATLRYKQQLNASEFRQTEFKSKTAERSTLDEHSRVSQNSFVSTHLHEDVPYYLYNFQSVKDEFSVAKYTQLAAGKIQEIINREKLPILVGGTGMYINSLLYGYNNIPEILSEVREEARDLQKTLSQEDFYKLLQNIDPLSGTKIKPNDSQRSLRAYEVFKQTGKSIITFQSAENILPLPDMDFEIVFLNPDRDLLYQICNGRLIDIFNNGALEEARSIKDNFSKLTTSAAKAIGLRELVSYLDNEISYEEAVVRAQQRTRQYAKRQVTWFKHQLKEKKVLDYSNLKEFLDLKNSFSLRGKLD